MHFMYFTEQPMSAYPAEEGLKFGATALMFPNKHFDPAEGSRLYNEFIDQYKLAEAVGFDGIMLNEHHNAPFCMQAKANVFAAVLAAMRKEPWADTYYIMVDVKDGAVTFHGFSRSDATKRGLRVLAEGVPGVT